MKYEVEKPGRLIDITHLPLKGIEEANGGLRLGALATNANVAYDSRVAERYPLLRNAILAGASAQLRNARRPAATCSSAPAATTFTMRHALQQARARLGCPAIGGVNRIHAIFGTSDQCIATHRPTCASRSPPWRRRCR